MLIHALPLSVFLFVTIVKYACVCARMPSPTHACCRKRAKKFYAVKAKVKRFAYASRFRNYYFILPSLNLFRLDHFIRYTHSRYFISPPGSLDAIAIGNYLLMHLLISLLTMGGCLSVANGDLWGSLNNIPEWSKCNRWSGFLAWCGVHCSIYIIVFSLVKAILIFSPHRRPCANRAYFYRANWIYDLFCIFFDADVRNLVSSQGHIHPRRLAARDSLTCPERFHCKEETSA